jgi:hypothetical protein
VNEIPRESFDRFIELLDRHGGDFGRWPPADAAFAAGILPRSADARRALEGARTLDAWLDEALPVPARNLEGLRDRILASVTPADVLAPLFAWLQRGPLLWRPVALALVPLVLGFWIGIGVPPSAGEDAELAGELDLLAFQDVEAYDDAQ